MIKKIFGYIFIDFVLSLILAVATGPSQTLVNLINGQLSDYQTGRLLFGLMSGMVAVPIAIWSFKRRWM